VCFTQVTWLYCSLTHINLSEILIQTYMTSIKTKKNKKTMNTYIAKQAPRFRFVDVQ
jgi:hypothetical protein